MVEQYPLKVLVGGSSPSWLTRKSQSHLALGFFCDLRRNPMSLKTEGRNPRGTSWLTHVAKFWGVPFALFD